MISPAATRSNPGNPARSDPQNGGPENSDTLIARLQQARARGFHQDPAQTRAAGQLQACLDALHAGCTVRGVYLHGPVGRGKTWLMDQFHACVRQPARRQHFHAFMREVHRQLFALSGQADPLALLAEAWAAETRVLCLDELQVIDIADAMILGALLRALIAAKVTLVITSNQAPAALYAGGFNRERFLPAVETLTTALTLVDLAGGPDHRLHANLPVQRYFLLHETQAFAAAFDAQAGESVRTSTPLQLCGRALTVRTRTPTLLCCRYAELCDQPWSALDYLSLCEGLEALFIEDVPALSAQVEASRIARGTEDGARRVAAGDRQLPALSRLDDSVRRFINLIDTCYDRRIPIYLLAAVPLDALYTEGGLLAPFQRSWSRLREMQTALFCKV